ncbi:MAG TPA: DUF3090 family protein [Candidatus Limnocylindrales bacterium]|jgi:uncharacterized repeat protein (TIGR03847 family)|nr:DUF3090 family protein [Candidatus Limnocylindrales bacterium]
MSRRIFTFESPDRFVCGAVGEPGQRTFFLQAAKNGRVVSVALEKAQVAVLAERLALLLLRLREQGVDAAAGTSAQIELPPQPETLDEPIVETFRVGSMILSWDEELERVVIEAQELGAVEVEADDDEDEDEVSDDDPDGPDLVRVHLQPTEAQTFVAGAVAVIQAGRPPCPNCGEALDPTGHFCARRNGYAH